MAMHLSNVGLSDFLVAADQTLCRVARLEHLIVIDPQSPNTP
jgi:hypothetical protein